MLWRAEGEGERASNCSKFYSWGLKFCHELLNKLKNRSLMDIYKFCKSCHGCTATTLGAPKLGEVKKSVGASRHLNKAC